MKTMLPKSLIFATVLSGSSLIAGAANWTNWNNGQSLGSFYAVAGTAKETVAVGIDGRIATRNNTTGVWHIQTFTGDPDFRAIVYANNQYVVVREAGYIMTSKDGLKWKSRKSPTKENLWDCSGTGINTLPVGTKARYWSARTVSIGRAAVREAT
jgi:hypothetical protein